MDSRERILKIASMRFQSKGLLRQGPATTALPKGAISLQALYPAGTDSHTWQQTTSAAPTWVPSPSAALR